MRYSCNVGRGFSVLIGASAVAVLFGLSAPPAGAASAQTSSVASSDHWTVETKKSHHATNRRYFIEFRSRAAASYGHMYVLYGRVNGRDEIVQSRIAGLHPAGDAENCVNCSLFNWTVGHVIFVPSETGASDGDLEEKYVTARYRVWLTLAEYKKIDAYIRKLQADSPMWNALWNNCVGFGRNIAEFMGLKVPLFAWLEPKDFVTDLRELNGLKKEQLPLKDAATAAASRSASRTPPLPPHRPQLGPAADAQQPATSENKPVAPDAKAPVPQAKPAASETKPASSKPKKPVVENAPANKPAVQAVASSRDAH
jgi:hypothetical protein